MVDSLELEAWSVCRGYVDENGGGVELPFPERALVQEMPRGVEAYYRGLRFLLLHSG